MIERNLLFYRAVVVLVTPTNQPTNNHHRILIIQAFFPDACTLHSKTNNDSRGDKHSVNLCYLYVRADSDTVLVPVDTSKNDTYNSSRCHH